MHAIKEEKTVVKNSTVKENDTALENGKKKSKEEKPPTKVVVRRLPPTMTEEQFKMQVSPLPEIDYFYFVQADMSLMPNAFCRAYLNFVDQSDLFIFTEKFDGYVFVDSKGGEYPAIVEFAPFQRIPKHRPNRKKDPKVGTIEADPLFIAFKERLEAENLERRSTANASKQHFFETSLAPEKKEVVNTPLLDYIKNRRAERQRIRDEKREEKRKKDLERRRAKEEQKRTKKEDDTSVVKVLNNQNSKDRSKDKDIKHSFIKKKTDDIKSTVKEKSTSELRSKEGRTRTGKSYLEERQRQAERREEQRKKLSQSQNSSETKSATAPEDNIANSDDKSQDEKPTTVSEDKDKSRDAEYKKPERYFKREEIRKNSYKYDKYESRRERESDDTRRTRRGNNDRGHPISKRDDERSEDSGRKRYSESRRSHDSSQRDRYKDKDRSKNYSQKKTTEPEKNHNAAENSEKSNENNEVIHKNIEKIKTETTEDNDLPEDNQMSRNVSSGDSKESKIEGVKDEEESGGKSHLFESKDKTKPTRRKSLDCDKVRSSSMYNSSIKYNENDKCSEKKRRNSLDSVKHNELENIEISSFKGDKETTKIEKAISLEKMSIEEHPLTDDKNKVPSNEENSTNEEEKKEFKEKEREIPKRRNSTGERQGPEKMSPRRNSLGSEDKNQVCTFKRDNFENGEVNEEEKAKSEKKTQRSSRDPRTERRIRNKDRPSIEIYRPGMGKFSKQRLEREKGLGSSTEVDSPSSSPSPTPVLKHKMVSLH